MCGLFAIINHHKRLLDKRAFITLGCVNDSRGGDACGIMIDRKVEKGTEKEDQYFQDWYHKSKLLQETEKCWVALGHCRKASVGGVAPEKAQPITIPDKDGNILFCLIHNGTIYNYEELAKKYIPELTITGLTDSQVMALIFFHKGYDVLSEYNGGGAFIIQDYRVNKTFLFKGESLGSYNAVKTEAERPLYFVKTGKSVVFSSIYSALCGLYWGFVTYDVPSNVLLECDGLNLYKVKEYDRTKCIGYRQYSRVTTSPTYTTVNQSYVSKVLLDTTTGLYLDSNTKELLHGIIHVSKYGYISSYKTLFNERFYFWKGIMISGENAYNEIRRLFDSKSLSDKQLINVVRRLSCNPVLINKRFYIYNKYYKKIAYNDYFAFPLTDTEMLCNSNGKPVVMYDTGDIEFFIPAEISKDTIENIIKYVKESI